MSERSRPVHNYLQKTANKYTCRRRERIDLSSVVFCRKEDFLLVFGYFEKHSHERAHFFQTQTLLKIVWSFLWLTCISFLYILTNIFTAKYAITEVESSLSFSIIKIIFCHSYYCYYC